MALWNSYSDEQLLASLKADDEGSLEEIYARYWDKLLAIAYNHSQDKELAEEIVQDVFMSLWRHRHDQEIRHLQAFLATAVKFSVFKALAREQRRRKLFERHIHIQGEGYLDTAADLKMMQEYIDNIVATLPEKCRLVFQYSRDRQLSTREIAETMQLSPKTVESHLTRALKTLRQYLNWMKMFSLLCCLLTCLPR